MFPSSLNEMLCSGAALCSLVAASCARNFGQSASAHACLRLVLDSGVINF